MSEVVLSSLFWGFLACFAPSAELLGEAVVRRVPQKSLEQEGASAIDGLCDLGQTRFPSLGSRNQAGLFQG